MLCCRIRKLNRYFVYIVSILLFIFNIEIILIYSKDTITVSELIFVLSINKWVSK